MNTDLKSSLHCANIANKALRRVGLIFRIFHTKEPELLKKAYCVYVRPLLEFSPSAWNPVLKKDIACVERVQRAFTRRLFKRCFDTCPPYYERIARLGLRTLEFRRDIYDMCMCFKIIRGCVELDVQDFFSFAQSSQLRGHPLKVQIERATSQKQVSTFKFRVQNKWNSLKPEIVTCPSLKAFRSKIISLYD